MNRSIRWLLTEVKVSNLMPNEINITDNKLVCYHLTKHSSWAAHDDEANRILNKRFNNEPEKEILDTDSRTERILKRLSNSQRGINKNDNPFHTIVKYREMRDHIYHSLEELIIMNMVDDPYTDTSGFTAGPGDYHGRGLYTCYKFNPKIASTYGDICIAFEIDISRFLICSEDLAKQVHGENWRIKDQLVKLYSEIEKDQTKIEAYKKLLTTFTENEFEMSLSINSNERTAHISQNIMRFFGKKNISSLYDGIIFFGQGDGPVCVSFYPKYDSRIIGLGRLSKNQNNIVDWYDSIDDFVGGNARNKLDFETMNDIAEENTDPYEKSQMKNSERKDFEPDKVSIANIFKLHDINRVLAFYKSSDEDKRSEIENYFIEKSDEVYFYNHQHVTFNESEIIDEMLLNIINKLKTTKKTYSLMSEFKDKLVDIIVKFVDTKIEISELLIEFALEHIDEFDIKKRFENTTNKNHLSFYKYRNEKLRKNFIVSLKNYLNVFTLNNSQLSSKITMLYEKYNLNIEENYKNLLFNLQNNRISLRKLSSLINDYRDDVFFNKYIENLNKAQTKDIINIILDYSLNPKVKNLTKNISNFIFELIYKEDIALSKHEQNIFASKIGKSHFDIKFKFSCYEHIDPDVFISLLEPDMKKGGMGSGQVYNRFSMSSNIYRLLYNHKKIVDLFARSAKSGMMRDIINNIIEELDGVYDRNLYPGYAFFSGNYSITKSIKDEINLNDADWFNYFLNTMRTSPSIRMLKKPLNNLEKVMEKKGMISHDSTLDLSHKIRFGKTLKEIYRF